MRPLNDKQRQFAAEYLVDFNATQAAIRAGYSKKTAAEQGYDLLRNPQIAAAIADGRARLIERTEISQDYVIRGLVRNAERAAQAEPVYDHEGNPTGEYTYQGAVVNGALKLIGQTMEMFIERRDLTTKGAKIPFGIFDAALHDVGDEPDAGE